MTKKLSREIITLPGSERLEDEPGPENGAGIGSKEGVINPLARPTARKTGLLEALGRKANGEGKTHLLPEGSGVTEQGLIKLVGDRAEAI